MTENNDIHIEESKCAFAGATGQAVSKGQTVRSVDGAQVTNNPKLRFKGFEGEWKTSMIESVFELRNGYTPSKAVKEFWEGGTIPWFRMEDIRANGGILKDAIQHITPLGVKGAGLFKKNSIILATTATIGEHAMLIADSLANQRFTNFKVRKSLMNKYIPEFIYYSFFGIDEWSKKNINSGGLLSVNIPLLMKQPFYTPSKDEQKQIASYFTHLDSLISSATSRLGALKQVKEASLQAMFPQDGETVPKIRFKGFDGDWKKEKLNSFAKRIMRKNSNLESTLALTIASAYGLVSQIDYFNNSVVGANLKNYYLLKKGEFAYNKSYSNGYPFGSVKRLDRYEQGILSTLYIVFDIDDSISSDYLTHFFDTTLWHKEVAERAAEGARNHGLLNIGAEDFLDINIWKPQTKEEQQKIASYFSALDRKIELQSQRLEKLKQIKAACLDKMFV